MSKELVKAGIIYTFSSVLLRGISFFSVPLFIRLLSTEEFGKYNIFISFEAVIFIIGGLAIHSSIKNAKYDFCDNYNEYIQNSVYLSFFSCSIVCLFGCVLSVLYRNLIGFNVFETILLCLSGFFQAVIAIYSEKLVMDYKSKQYIYISIITIVAGIGFSILFIYTICNEDHYLGRILGGIIGQFFASCLALYYIFNNDIKKIRLKYWIYGLKISLPIVPHGLSQIVLSSSNRIIINYIFNATLAGIFSFTYTISLLPQILFNSISNVWGPWIFENLNKGNIENIKRGSTKFAFIISLVFIIFSSLVPEIIHILGTSDYYDAIDISIVVLLGCYFATLYYIPCEIEYYHKKTKYIALSTMACAIINIVLNILLMQFLSYKVAAYVTLVSYLLYFIFHLIVVKKIEKRKVFEIKKIVLIIIFTTLLIFISFLCIDFLPIRIVNIIICVICSILFFKQDIKKIIINGNNKNLGRYR